MKIERIYKVHKYAGSVITKTTSVWSMTNRISLNDSLCTGIKPSLPTYVFVSGLMLSLKRKYHLLTEKGIHEPLVCS